MTKTSFLLETLIKSGYQPLAIEPNGKGPVHKAWTTRTISIDELTSRNSGRFGLRMGGHGLNCIDVDSKNHPSPELMRKEFFEMLKQSGFDDSKVLIQETPSTGAHLIYRADSPRKSEVLSRTKDKSTLVEVRGSKTQVLMYETEKFERIPELKTLSKGEEQILYSIARSFDEAPNEPSNYKDYNSSYSSLHLLQQKGWTVVGEDDLATLVLRPGDTSSKTSGKVFHDSNKFYCFSASTAFEPNRAHSAADITITLDYHGDQKEFERAMGFSKKTITEELNRKYFATSTVSDMRILSQKEPPKMLLGGLIHEKENAILFASTNAGKSILGLQIAKAVSEGKAVCEALPNELEPIATALFDFELSPQQLAQRIKNATDDYPRLRFFHPTGDVYAKPEDICLHIESAIVEHGAQFVVIDNISMLAYDNESAADAKLLVQGLKELRQRHDLTLLLIGHSPKKAKNTPIEIKDLAGSAMVGNMFDAVIGLNWSSHGPQHRYIKQLKVRTGAYEFAEDNVLGCCIVANDTLGVYFEFHGTSTEGSHLQALADNRERDEEIIRLHEGGQSHRDISAIVGIGKSRVGEIIKKYKSVRPPE